RERRVASNSTESLTILLVQQPWFKTELELLGHTVLTAGYRQGGFDLTVQYAGISLEEMFNTLGTVPDRIVVLDASTTPWFTGLERSTVPSVFLSVDTHHHFEWHKYYAKLFDHVFISQYPYIESGQFKREEVEWMPLWITQDVKPA